MNCCALLLSLSLGTAALAQTETASASTAGPRANAWGVNSSLAGGSGLAAGGTVPTVGARVVISEKLALNLDGGFELFSSGSTAAGFTLGLGADIFFAQRGALAPFGTLGFTLGLDANPGDQNFSLAPSAGFGLEHWFGEHFSLAARLLVGLPITFEPTVVRLFTFTPGIRATFWF